MEIEMLTMLSQAPALVVIVWLVMKQNGNGNQELIRAISRSLEKLADAQREANLIAEQRQKGFEKWLELQKTQCRPQFESRKQK